MVLEELDGEKPSKPPPRRMAVMENNNNREPQKPPPAREGPRKPAEDCDNRESPKLQQKAAQMGWEGSFAIPSKWTEIIQGVPPTA
jgi:hypothetical protein